MECVEGFLLAPGGPITPDKNLHMAITLTEGGDIYNIFGILCVFSIIGAGETLHGSYINRVSMLI